ncbi:hypothetical protein BJX65DRAFT_152247 [Aspergillus insuetus]
MDLPFWQVVGKSWALAGVFKVWYFAMLRWTDQGVKPYARSLILLYSKARLVGSLSWFLELTCHFFKWSRVTAGVE